MMFLPVEGQDSTCLLNLPLQFISKEHDLKAVKQQLDKNLKTNSASRFKNGDKKEKKKLECLVQSFLRYTQT